MGQERARSFLKKVDASRFAATVEADILRGEWTDPRLSKTTVSEWSERWYRTKSALKPKTLAGYDSNLRVHVLPAFGDYELRHLDRMAVEEWVADLQAFGLGPSAVRQARQVLNSMMKLAVEAGYLLVNPVTGGDDAPPKRSRNAVLVGRRGRTTCRCYPTALCAPCVPPCLRRAPVGRSGRGPPQTLSPASVASRSGRVARRGQGSARVRNDKNPSAADGGDPRFSRRPTGRTSCSK